MHTATKPPASGEQKPSARAVENYVDNPDGSICGSSGPRLSWFQHIPRSISMHTAPMPPAPGEQKLSARAVRDAALAAVADPVLGFEFVKADLGISHATFFRTVRHQLPIIQFVYPPVRCAAQRL